MKVFVYYEDSRDGSRRIEKRAVDPDYLEEEMDAIEYLFAKPGKFRFIPSRSSQIDLIRECLAVGCFDPFYAHWPFRQAFLNQQWNK